MTNQPPKELDWVNERFKCSLQSVFVQLLMDARLDVQRRNELKTQGAGSSFEIKEHADSFAVVRYINDDPQPSIVRFSLKHAYIEIARNDGTDALTVGVGLNDNGECVLKMQGKEYFRWQLLRVALEAIFFETT